MTTRIDDPMVEVDAVRYVLDRMAREVAVMMARNLARAEQGPTTTAPKGTIEIEEVS